MPKIEIETREIDGAVCQNVGRPGGSKVWVPLEDVKAEKDTVEAEKESN